MHSPFLEKHALIEAAIEALETADGTKRTNLLNGLWWIADCLEEQIKSDKIPNLQHAIAEIYYIKEAAGDAIKNPQTAMDFRSLKGSWYKLGNDAPEWHEPE